MPNIVENLKNRITKTTDNIKSKLSTSNNSSQTEQSTEVESTDSKLNGIDIYKDDNDVKYTKQRTFELLIGLMNGSMLGGGVNGNWYSAVQQMGQWYQNNIHTYQGKTQKPWAGKHWYMCPLINGEVADDCSGFVQACLKLFGVKCPTIATSSMQDGSPFMKLMENSGFTHYSGQFTPENLQPGDIVCGKAATHTEIYAGDNKSWSWGSIHDGQNGHRGMPCGFCSISSRGGYIHCWRKI